MRPVFFNLSVYLYTIIQHNDGSFLLPHVQLRHICIQASHPTVVRLCLASSLTFQFYCYLHGARGGAVGSGTALQAGRPRVQFPIVSEFFINP